MATGSTIEPVAPRIASGRATNRNSRTPRRGQRPRGRGSRAGRCPARSAAACGPAAGWPARRGRAPAGPRRSPCPSRWRRRRARAAGARRRCRGRRRGARPAAPGRARRTGSPCARARRRPPPRATPVAASIASSSSAVTGSPAGSAVDPAVAGDVVEHAAPPERRDLGRVADAAARSRRGLRAPSRRASGPRRRSSCARARRCARRCGWCPSRARSCSRGTRRWAAPTAGRPRARMPCGVR